MLFSDLVEALPGPSFWLSPPRAPRTVYWLPRPLRGSMFFYDPCFFLFEVQFGFFLPGVLPLLAPPNSPGGGCQFVFFPPLFPRIVAAPPDILLPTVRGILLSSGSPPMRDRSLTFFPCRVLISLKDRACGGFFEFARLVFLESFLCGTPDVPAKPL